MQTQEVKTLTPQDGSIVTNHELATELEDIFFLSERLGANEAIRSVSLLLDDYQKENPDEWLSNSAALDTMRFFTNAIFLRNRIQGVLEQFFGKEVDHE